MFDVAIISSCADPAVPLEIVERFIATVGNENPLAISITSGNRIILPEPPSTAEEAAILAQHFVGTAVVRAGVTAFPVGVGIADASQITAVLFDACENVRIGTALFGKVYRTVANAQPGDDGAVLQDAIEAWRSGQFEGRNVFATPDTQDAGLVVRGLEDPGLEVGPSIGTVATPSTDLASPDPYMAGIRVEVPSMIGH